MLPLYCTSHLYIYSRMHLRRIRRFTPRWRGTRAVLLRHRRDRGTTRERKRITIDKLSSLLREDREGLLSRVGNVITVPN